MRPLLLLILCAGLAWGNACATTATGSLWSQTAHWTTCGGVTPQPGDTVTIGHATTVDANATIGTSPAAGGTVALDIWAALTVATGIELRVRGPVTQNDAAITFNAGSIFTFDGHLAASPSTAKYAWTCNAFTRGTRMITMSGTSGSRVTIRSDAGGGAGYFYAAPGYSDSLWLNSYYTDFQSIGDSVNDAANPNGGGAAPYLIFKFCTFDANSGALRLPDTWAAGGWYVEDNKFLQTNSWYNTGYYARIPVYFGSTAGTVTAPRTCYRNVFVYPPAILPNGLDMIDNVFLGSWVSNSNSLLWTQMTGSFVVGYEMTAPGPITDGYFLVDLASTISDSGTATGATGTTLVDSGKSWTTNQYSPGGSVYAIEIMSGTGIGQRRLITGTSATTITVAYRWDVNPTAGSTYQIKADVYNPHFVNSGYGTTGVTATFDGLIFQNAGTDTQGDCLLHMDTNNTYNVIRFLVLPNGMGDSSCTPITAFSSNTGTFNVEKSTWFSGAQAMSISEQTAGLANRITKLKSNIAWSDPARTYYAHGGSGGPYLVTSVAGAAADTVDVIAVGAADYNATWGVGDGYAKTTLFPGTAGRGYNAKFSAAPGTHDVYGDPAFVDPTRNFQKWAVLRGSSATTVAGKIADGITYLMADPTLTRTSLIPYVRGGFAPTNAAYKNAGYDGGDIGAVAALVTASKIRRKVINQ